MKTPAVTQRPKAILILLMLLLAVGDSLAAQSRTKDRSRKRAHRIFAAQTGPDQVTLAWDEVPGATEYRIYLPDPNKPGPPEPGSRPTMSFSGSGRRATVMGVQRMAGGAYLEALGQGEVLYRGTFNAVARAPLARPTAPGSVQARETGETEVTLSWNPVPGATAYMISRAAGGSGWQMLCDVCPPGGEFVDAEATPGLDHTYSVAAIFPLGISTRTPSNRLTVGAAQLAASAASAPPAAAWDKPMSSGTPVSVTDANNSNVGASAGTPTTASGTTTSNPMGQMPNGIAGAVGNQVNPASTTTHSATPVATTTPGTTTPATNPIGQMLNGMAGAIGNQVNPASTTTHSATPVATTTSGTTTPASNPIGQMLNGAAGAIGNQVNPVSTTTHSATPVTTTTTGTGTGTPTTTTGTTTTGTPPGTGTGTPTGSTPGGMPAANTQTSGNPGSWPSGVSGASVNVTNPYTPGGTPAGSMPGQQVPTSNTTTQPTITHPATTTTTTATTTNLASTDYQQGLSLNPGATGYPELWNPVATASGMTSAERIAAWKEIGIVALEYKHILGRQPTPDETRRDVAVLKGGTTWKQLWRQLAHSAERDTRYGFWAAAPIPDSFLAQQDFGTAVPPWTSQQCYGALGPKCNGGIPEVINNKVGPIWFDAFYMPDNTRLAYVEIGVAVGSVLHDNACLKDKDGLNCNGVGAGDLIKTGLWPAGLEWNKAAWNVIDQRTWRQTFGPYPADQSTRELDWYDDLRPATPRPAMMAPAASMITVPLLIVKPTDGETRQSRALRAPMGTSLDDTDVAFCRSGAFASTGWFLGKASWGTCK